MKSDGRFVGVLLTVLLGLTAGCISTSSRSVERINQGGVSVERVTADGRTTTYVNGAVVNYTGPLSGLLIQGGSVQINGGTVPVGNLKEARKSAGGPIGAETPRITVNNRNGAVIVRAVGEGFNWSWDASCSAVAMEDAERLLDSMRMDVQSGTDGTTWSLILPDFKGLPVVGFGSALILKVPASVSVVVKNSYGDTGIEGVQGSVLARLEHSKATLENIAGAVDLKTSFQPVLARGIGGGSLVNEHGDVRVEGVGADLEVVTSFDDVRITDAAGGVRVTNEHGEVNLLRIAGTVHARSSFDPVIVEDVGGKATLRNEHGKIRAVGVRGGLDARTTLGKLIARSSGPEVFLRNDHGAIDFTLERGPLGRVQVETSFGELKVRVPRGMRPDVYVSSKMGEVDSFLPVFMGTKKARAREASGGPWLELTNNFGDVRVIPVD